MVTGCLQLSDVNVICRVVNPHPTCQKNLGVRTVYGLYWPGNWLWTVKMETRNSIKGYFGTEFRATYDHCTVMAAWSGKTLKIEKCLHFLDKLPFTAKLSKLCSKRFHRDTDQHVVFKLRKICPTANRRNHALLTWQKQNKILPGSPAVTTALIAPKLSGPAFNNVLRVLQFHPNQFTLHKSYS